MSADPLPIHAILSRLGAVRKAGERNWLATCPAHEDHRASLSVGVSDTGTILLNCHAGCSFDSITAALQIQPKQLFADGGTKPERFDRSRGRIVTTYDYRDESGQLLYQVCRFEPKDFRQRKPDGSGGWNWKMNGVRKVPYRLNELRGHERLYLVEGEKDADALWSLGLPATTSSGGAGKWKDDYADDLKRIGVKQLVLLPDNDAPGRKHTTDVASSAKKCGLAVMNVSLQVPPKGDVSDWLKAGHRREELEAIVSQTLWIVPPNFEPTPKPPPSPDHDPTRWPQTDLGAAEAFAWREGENIRYDCLQDQWLVWTRHLWQPDADQEIRRRAHAHIRKWQTEATERIEDKADRLAWIDYLCKLESRAKTENMLSIAQSLRPIADAGKDWNKTPWAMVCPNGVIDLKTGQLRDGLRDDRITVQTPTIFDAAAICPRWDLFLREVFNADDDLIAYIQRALGYSLTGDISEQCFFMCVGAGSNGKSTFLNAVSGVWGEYAYMTDMRTFASGVNDSEKSFDLAELANRRLVLASETKANSRVNEQALKNFTGGEAINAQRKFGHPFVYEPVGKIWMGLNHQPRVMDDSFGFWRRVRIIPFTRIFAGSGSNPKLKAELAAEAPGILAWAVRGCLEWQRTGLMPPACVFTATDAYKESEDPLNEFLIECCVSEADTHTPAAGAFLAYKDWAKEQGLGDREMLSSTSFGRLMGRRYEKIHTMQGKRYVGVRVNRRPKDLLENAHYN